MGGLGGFASSHVGAVDVTGALRRHPAFGNRHPVESDSRLRALKPDFTGLLGCRRLTAAGDLLVNVKDSF